MKISDMDYGKIDWFSIKRDSEPDSIRIVGMVDMSKSTLSKEWHRQSILNLTKWSPMEALQ